MNHRKNFVTAMFAVADMDKLLAEMDQLFKVYHKLVMQKEKGEIDQEYFIQKVKQIAHKRKLIFQKYDRITEKINQIKDQFGGEVRE